MRFRSFLRRGAWLHGVFFFTLLFPVAGRPAEPQEEILTQRMEGYAEGIGLGARARAIENAQVEVVRSILLKTVASQDLTHLRAILRNAPKYIKNYVPLRHDQVGDGTRVEIDAYVSTAPLYQDVAAVMLPFLVRPPRVLLVIGEQLGDDQIVAVPDFGAAETSLKTGLEPLKLEVQGVDSLGDTYTQAQLIAAVKDLEAGMAFARGQQQDTVIIGTAIAEAQPGAETGNVQRNKVTVSLRVHRAADGDVLETLTQTAAVSSVDIMEGGEQATRDACAKVVGDLTVATVLAVLSQPVTQGVMLLLQEPPGEDAVKAIVEQLKEAGGGEETRLVSYADPLARVFVPFEGPMADFVNYLSDETFAGHQLEVLRVVGQDVTARFAAE